MVNESLCQMPGIMNYRQPPDLPCTKPVGTDWMASSAGWFFLLTDVHLVLVHVHLAPLSCLHQCSWESFWNKHPNINESGRGVISPVDWSQDSSWKTSRLGLVCIFVLYSKITRCKILQKHVCVSRLLRATTLGFSSFSRSLCSSSK